MKACLLTYEADAHVLPRIQLLGHSVRAESPDRIESLGPNTTDTVYLIPWELMTIESWPEHRVLLARASRYYLVYGQDLSTEQIMNAARDGAYDVLDEADNDERWNTAMESAAGSQALWWQLYGGLGSAQDEKLVGQSKPMQGLRESIQRIGATDAKVLITGESGTGKELVAECLHEVQDRGKFVAVNCAAIPAELLESELFGVKRGAYTGANTDKPGLVEEAAGGTLFLDEIGEMDITLQPKLLRFLETQMARRVGSTKEYRCNVRVVSATNRDLRSDAEAGSFRLDLYYRISEVILTTPPLRHRVQDIAELVRVFLDAAAIRLGKNFETIEPELIAAFQEYDWPGNVRELKQVIDRLAIHYTGPVLRAGWWDIPELPDPRSTILPGGYKKIRHTQTPFPRNSRTPFRAPSAPPYPLHEGAARNTPSPMPYAPSSRAGAPQRLPSKKEKYALARQLLKDSGDDLAWVAAQLGIHPTTLYRWRKSGKV